jgi:hypothetical protein
MPVVLRERERENSLYSLFSKRKCVKLMVQFSFLYFCKLIWAGLSYNASLHPNAVFLRLRSSHVVSSCACWIDGNEQDRLPSFNLCSLIWADLSFNHAALHPIAVFQHSLVWHVLFIISCTLWY